MKNVSKEELKEARRKVAKHCQYLDDRRSRYWEQYRLVIDDVDAYAVIDKLLDDGYLMDAQYHDMEFVLMILDEILAER